MRLHTLLFVLALGLLAACPEAPDDDDLDPDDDDVTADDDDATDSCADIVTFETGLAPTRVHDVVADAAPGSGDGSEEFPFASIEEAAAVVQPGEAIGLHGGTYPGGTYLVDLHGTEGAPIWIGPAPGEVVPVVIDATGSNEGLHLVGARYVVVHGLEILGAADNGINADDGGASDDPDASRHLVFRDLDLHDIGPVGNHDCLKLSGLDDYFVLDSSFARCGGDGSGSAVDHVGCHAGLIARNTFSELSANAVQAKGGSEDIEIRWNRFFDAGDRSVNLGGSTGLSFFRPPVSEVDSNAEARDIRVVGNLIVGAEASVAYVGCVGCVVAHNTIVDPDRWVMRILQETVSNPINLFDPVSDGRFVNNLVYFDRSALSTFANIGPDTAPETFTFAGNLWYAHDDPGSSAPELPATETGSVIGQDPSFDSDPVTGDGSLQPDSPAIGAGDPGEAAWLVGDIEGRCYADPPTIGAWAAGK